jgi:hypothetical protein
VLAAFFHADCNALLTSRRPDVLGTALYAHITLEKQTPAEGISRCPQALALGKGMTTVSARQFETAPSAHPGLYRIAQSGKKRLCDTLRMSQASYRIVPLSIIRYGIEVMRPDKAARILLTCPSEHAANAWMAEIKRRSEDRPLHD